MMIPQIRVLIFLDYSEPLLGRHKLSQVALLETQGHTRPYSVFCWLKVRVILGRLCPPFLLVTLLVAHVVFQLGVVRCHFHLITNFDTIL
jgi:hypothetical protein